MFVSSMNFMNAYGYDLSINKKDLDDKHVQSRFLKVEPQHWKAAIFLPTHNFVGANTRTVYQNSNKAMQ